MAQVQHVSGGWGLGRIEEEEVELTVYGGGGTESRRCFAREVTQFE